ncbi:MAG TPA: hypothetical protein IAB71_04135 [Candidatus Scatomonas pullistercoris]|uniref:Uncharacterized protein n=1 Tax=Candidatus Scatomonas pullistercoris TaxID=2840920 RepID=A0A9D1P2W0_9FIRM|nr:hypothetical protein [Candidatus Scatomonas pullistercoris]
MEEKVWVEKYYLETDRERRKEMLDQAIAEEGMTRENEIRLKFWERRYETREKDNVQIDRFIRGWMEMSYMNTSSRSAFGRKKLEREKEKVLDDWSMELARSYGEEGEEAFYQELCNMTRLYLQLCQEDKSYSSLILGIGTMKRESLINKIAMDVYTMAYAVPRFTGTEELFSTFTRAATDVFYETFPKNRELLEKRISGELKK